MAAIFIKLILTFTIFYMMKCQTSNKPNIVIIMADDMGSNDASFHGSDQILTPNIDALAYHGVILNRFYTPPMCTPSRSSMLTGKYSNRVGMQHSVIFNDEPWALSKTEKIMPQYFKDAGYRTHLIGKWHQGFYQRQYTPTFRGFDSFFGFYGGFVGYYDFSFQMFIRDLANGFDLRKNITAYHDYPKGTYATDLFTSEAVKTIDEHNFDIPLFIQLNHLAPHGSNFKNPLEAPESEILKFSHIKNENRRILAAMISKLDSSVGEVVEALDKRNVLNNTVILFYSDNGGPTVSQQATNASNYPLRGQKGAGWEGAIRNIAVVYSPLLKKKQRVSDELIHVTDLLPTFASLAGFKVLTDLDGIDQWKTISEGQPSQRKEILHHTDPILGFSSYMYDNWKLVNGTTGDILDNGWLGKTEETVIDSSSYIKKILSSPVHSVIQKIEGNLTSAKILNLRNQALVKCAVEKPIENYNCDPLKAPCLFNIIADPCEQINLAAFNPNQLQEMELRMGNLISLSVPCRQKPYDPKSHPKYFNNTWEWWQPDNYVMDSKGNRIDFRLKLLSILIIFLFYLYDMRK